MLAKEDPQNCKLRVKGNILTIQVDISKTIGDTKSGKNRSIGSTKGDFALLSKGQDGKHTGIRVNLNVYRALLPDEK